MAGCSSDSKNEHNHTNGNKDNDDDFCDQFRYFVSVEILLIFIQFIGNGSIVRLKQADCQLEIVLFANLNIDLRKIHVTSKLFYV